jgi:hypothetical protein
MTHIAGFVSTGMLLRQIADDGSSQRIRGTRLGARLDAL